MHEHETGSHVGVFDGQLFGLIHLQEQLLESNVGVVEGHSSGFYEHIQEQVESSHDGLLAGHFAVGFLQIHEQAFWSHVGLLAGHGSVGLKH